MQIRQVDADRAGASDLDVPRCPPCRPRRRAAACDRAPSPRRPGARVRIRRGRRAGGASAAAACVRKRYAQQSNVPNAATHAAPRATRAARARFRHPMRGALRPAGSGRAERRACRATSTRSTRRPPASVSSSSAGPRSFRVTCAALRSGTSISIWKRPSPRVLTLSAAGRWCQSAARSRPCRSSGTRSTSRSSRRSRRASAKPKFFWKGRERRVDVPTAAVRVLSCHRLHAGSLTLAAVCVNGAARRRGRGRRGLRSRGCTRSSAVIGVIPTMPSPCSAGCREPGRRSSRRSAA